MNKTDSDDNLAILASRALPTRRRIGMKVLLSLVIFGSGAIVGTCATLLLIRHQLHYRIHHPEEMPAKLASRLQWKLDLSDGQTEQVESILNDQQQAIQEIRREFQPRLERQLDQMEEQVGGLLEESQLATWQEWFREMRTRWIPDAPQSNRP